MKIISFYLPQFHTFPENDQWWGKGFTEWVSVKSAEPQYKGQYQPRVPLNQNYYDLTDVKNMVWQAEMAKKYGVYGFCYYHYWFDGKMLMEKPVDQMLHTPEVDIPFCLCWANENWTKAWATNQKEILISQTYGDKKDWKKHFEYFLEFFQDKRYIRIDGKPLLIIYRPEIIPTLKEMLECWNSMAIESGLAGITYVYQQKDYNHQTDENGELFSYGIEYQPSRVMADQRKTLSVFVEKAKRVFSNHIGLYDYDDAWERILATKPMDEKMFPGAFVDWDNTPRYKEKASIYKGVTPEKFEKYLTRQILHAKEVYKKDMMFMFAWNEWGEGGYLEPDEKYGYRMLEAIQNSLNNTGEFPDYP